MNRLPIKIKQLNELCETLHLDLVVKYYSEREVCFKGVNDNDEEIFMVSVWYPKDKRVFYIELNSEKEEWRGGHFTKEEMLLLLSIDDLSDDELGIRKQFEV